MSKKVALRWFVIMLILALLLSFGHHSCAHAASEPTPPLVITEIYPDTATKNELDEYLTITNPGSRTVNIGGWSITDNEGTIIFPSFEVRQHQTLYLSKNASAFIEQMRSVGKELFPDFEYGADSDPRVSQMQTVGRAVAFRNAGDEVILRDKNGREVDVVLYGDSSYQGSGWSGESLKNPREGMVLRRRGIQDTNQCEDWLMLPFGTSYHAPERIAVSGTVTTFVSPDCSFSVLQREIEHATSSLHLNLYQFENPYLMDSILDAVKRGVQVSLLLEGSPVGGITDDERYIASQVSERGGSVRFSDDPFVNHAKYAVVDNKTLILMTENWGDTGVPLNNSFGNRGWGIVIQNERVAKYFKEAFLEDFYRGKEYAPDGKDPKLSSFIMSRTIPQGAYLPVFEPQTATCRLTVIPLFAPDNVLSNQTILGLLNGATERICVQQFSVARVWGEADNPFITALLNAARRGCEVKLLLDSNEYNLDAWNDNDETMAWINERAAEENLSLEAKLVDLDSLGLAKLHTKGLIVDGKVVVIASLNWNANSIYNREAGIIVENEDLGSYYEAVFFHDWNLSAKRGLAGPGAGEEGAASRTPLKMKVIGVAVTLMLALAIYWIVRWYKRA
ncbi:MAG: hypothetical protein EFT35_01805 [Methanophagales archaeon ANME-1-THS]|nr:MAG: hypothetical protein EFT35_01805 [Methanophagales archaeon ANME-1-THS]